MQISSTMNIRTATPPSVSTQADSSSVARATLASSAVGVLYPSSADRTALVDQLDSADKLAGLAFLCLREGDVQRAQQYMQEATDIRKSVEPKLTGPQQQSLEKIMSLQQDAYQNIQNANNNWITGVFGQFKAALDLSQASTESTNLRNSILSEGQVKAMA